MKLATSPQNNDSLQPLRRLIKPLLPYTRPDSACPRCSSNQSSLQKVCRLCLNNTFPKLLQKYGQLAASLSPMRSRPGWADEVTFGGRIKRPDASPSLHVLVNR